MYKLCKWIYGLAAADRNRASWGGRLAYQGNPRAHGFGGAAAFAVCTDRQGGVMTAAEDAGSQQDSRANHTPSRKLAPGVAKGDKEELYSIIVDFRIAIQQDRDRLYKTRDPSVEGIKLAQDKAVKRLYAWLHKAEIDHTIDVRYESDLMEAFNKFIQKWCGDYYPHLIDSDENDGEFIRQKIDALTNEAERLTEEKEHE